MRHSEEGATAYANTMLQSEYDAIVSQKRIKILLIILTTLTVALVLYAVIKVGREKMSVQEPAVVTPRDTMTPPSPEEIQKRLEELSKTRDGETPPPPPTPEEITKRLEELSKTRDGETPPPPPTPEEIQQRLNELSKKK